MARTAFISLDGVQYQIRAFNIGELEKIQQAGNDAWVVLRLALSRAEPKVADASLLEPTPEEITQAFKTIMELAGLKPPDPTPGAPPAAP